MMSCKKQTLAAALAFAVVAAGSAPVLAQYAGLPYGAHRVHGTHPNQVAPRSYYDHGAPGAFYGDAAPSYGNAAPGGYYDYAAPGYGYSAPGYGYYDYAPGYGNSAASVPSQFYECPPKCW
jgi:hypothetical protein